MTDPTVHEMAVAGLLHDIGKLLQRAHVGQALPEKVRERASDVLPIEDGRQSHGHALWTDLFFEQCGDGTLPWPRALDRSVVRTLAVDHHRPLQEYRVAPNVLLSELVIWADRLATGRERTARDEAAEEAASETTAPATKDRTSYLTTPLKAIVSSVEIGRGVTKPQWHLPEPLAPNAIFPLARPGADGMANGYRAAWEAFVEGWGALCAVAGGDPAAFEEGLLSLSERTLWAVPSSTVDEPDVSLHDHARAVAAFAAALFRFHEAEGTLTNVRALTDGEAAKFRFLVGDLSGLQTTLFRFRSEGVQGLAKALRGRSMRLQLIADAAVRRVLDAFAMPASAALQVAGGRFLLLVPAYRDAEERLSSLRHEADCWFAQAYTGDLALGLALSQPFAPWDLMPKPDEGANRTPARQRAVSVREKLGIAIETAKLRQLSQPANDSVLKLRYEAGGCPVCGLRPASGTASASEPCPSCAAEIEIGRRLPKARAVVIKRGALAPDAILTLDYHFALGEGKDAPDNSRGWRWLRFRGNGPAPMRPGPAYVARFREGDALHYAERAKANGVILSGADEIEPDAIKTFECLALDALEELPGEKKRKFLGRPLLALLKGDVDQLGKIFAHGLGPEWSIARASALSRTIDAYFSLRLPELLERKFPETYTVFAGGDDFMIVAPWRQGFALALKLAEDFRAFAGENPNLTFSLGIALFDPRTPISMAAREAEERLEAAKAAGRDRISAIEPVPLSWREFKDALAEAERLCGWIRDGTLSVALVYRLLALERARRRIDAESARLADYGWLGRLGYALARARTADGKPLPREVVEAVRALFAITPAFRPRESAPRGVELALTHALYRNR